MMNKLSLEHLAYHVVPATIGFLIFSLANLIFGKISTFAVFLILLIQIAIMQFIMNANTRAKRPYVTVSNISGYVKPKRLSAALINILGAGVLIVLFNWVFGIQFGNYLLAGPFVKFSPLVTFVPETLEGWMGAYLLPALSVLFFGIAMPIFEGIYFRGFLLYDMRKLKWTGVAISGVLYALTHIMTLHLFPYYLAVGLLLAALTFATKNLYLGILAEILAYISGVVLISIGIFK